MRTSGAIGGANPSSLLKKGVPSNHESDVDLPQPVVAGWQLSGGPPDLKITFSRTGAFGHLGQSAKDIFGGYSPALTAPSATFHVAPTGDDTTGSGAETAPFRSIHKAITSANSTGAPAKIIVDAGEYPRFANPSNGGSVMPEVDMAILARGGGVTTGTFNLFASP